MCDRKYRFGSSYIEESKHAQKRSTRKTIFMYIKEWSITHFLFLKSFKFYIPFKNLHV